MNHLPQIEVTVLQKVHLNMNCAIHVREPEGVVYAGEVVDTLTMGILHYALLVMLLENVGIAMDQVNNNHV